MKEIGEEKEGRADRDGNNPPVYINLIRGRYYKTKTTACNSSNYEV